MGLFDCACGYIHPATDTCVHTHTHACVNIPGEFVCVFGCVGYNTPYGEREQTVRLENTCEITGILLRYTACLTYSI